MAGSSNNDFQNGAPFYLDPNQQDLLLAALASNTQNPNDIFATGLDKHQQQALAGSQFQYPVDGLDPTFFTSPQQSTPGTAFNNGGSIDESPFLDYVDGDNSFDFEGNDDLMIGALPGDSPGKKNGESTEKRKSPDDDVEDPDGGGKRREPEDKQAKKPGRKPLTSEPTTKRKAQNRAAQRAFRERKEKHLKDLETKVAELEKASDSANHENGLLRAQVQRLQMELREYRKRLSLNSTAVNRSPPIASGFSSLLGANGANNSNFQFEFPRFGGLPGAHILDNGHLAKSATKPTSVSSAVPARHNSTGRSISPRSQTNGSVVNSPDQSGASPASNGVQRSGSLNGLFNYNNQPGAKTSRSNTESSTSHSRVFQFNSGSSTHSDSPSASSTSQLGQNSSCDTSPEPSHNSPNNPDTIADGYVCHGNSEGEITFCEKLNMACGNPRNPIPRAMSSSDAKSSPAAPAKTPSADVNGIDFFANQNGGQFDPTLFGDYRDSQNAIVGDGEFSGGFFNDAFPIADFGSPFHFGDTPAVQKPNPLEEIERIQDGEDEVVPGEDMSQMLNCHKIWDKLSGRADFKDGTIDIDNLCSELRAKARCSESGVVVDHKDVEAALKRLPAEQGK
ncbi:PAP1-domain-containing protein [Corynespora cassiicola Philippines]|uniref:PAP1-domain-containing protein n=1 Tax=Corynespora cassiicola Philippines TaxID=1448308 RepID=A0A2T2P6V6_CORCC|nr:PAP1-domain-containing protein [Corynespora cassiicola Philippines]